MNLLKFLKRKKVEDKKYSASLISFDEPEPILTSMTDYAGVSIDGGSDFYTMPIEPLGLAQLVNLNPQHGGIIYSRSSMLTSSYISGVLTRDHMEMAAMDFTIFGHVFFVKVKNGFGQIIDLFPLPSLYTRVKKDYSVVVLQEGETITYLPSEIISVKRYDPQQRVYGLPDYVSGIHSSLLNSEATIFRRRYFHNGAHLGYIFYATDPSLSTEVEDDIKEKISRSKGVGNFRSMFINIPNGDPDGVKIIPVGDMGAKDEFSNIKNISAQDVLTAHRFPAGIAGIIPTNAGGTGDIDKARSDYIVNEVIPLGQKFEEAINSDPEIPNHLKVNFIKPEITQESGKIKPEE